MQEATIFSIEEFAVHDGPGIRTTIFFKGCPLRCVWCHNPEGISPSAQQIIKNGVRSICGYSITSSELAAQILKNKEIYAFSQGGITFTGGEPLMQAGFINELLDLIPGVHCAIETSGYSSPEVFRELIPKHDLVMFDIKHTDPQIHKKYTGVDNAPILANLRHLCSSGKEFIVRIPLIPGVNDTEENMRGILSLISDARSLQRVEFMRYHQTAGAKYGMIGRIYDPPFDTTLTPLIHDIFEPNGIKTLIL